MLSCTPATGWKVMKGNIIASCIREETEGGFSEILHALFRQLQRQADAQMRRTEDCRRLHKEETKNLRRSGSNPDRHILFLIRFASVFGVLHHDSGDQQHPAPPRHRLCCYCQRSRRDCDHADRVPKRVFPIIHFFTSTKIIRELKLISY